MMDEGYTLLDARIESQYEEGHPAGALNAPLYRLVPEEKTDFWNMSKKITSTLLMQDATGKCRILQCLLNYELYVSSLS